MSEKDAKDYADSIHAIFVETSAKNAININEIFTEISKEAQTVISATHLCFTIKHSEGQKLGSRLQYWA